ncbi:hypothetical protein KQI84_05015 [bacterium]|nr:hypothetical protein [bacterium]
MSERVDLPTLPYMELSPDVAMAPTLLHSLSGANEARRALFAFQPQCVAIEVPRAVRAAFLQGLEELPRVGMIAFKEPKGRSPLVLAMDPCDARIEAARLALENGIRVELVDTLDAGRGETYRSHPDPLALERIGAAAFAEQWMKAMPDVAETTRQKIMAGRIARLAGETRTLVVADVQHTAAFRRLLADRKKAANLPDIDAERELVRLLPMGERLLPLLLGEMPYLTYLYENFRQQASGDEQFEVLPALSEILNKASAQYRDEFDEEVNLTEWRALYQFGRNLSLVRGRLVPGIYELVIASKGCVDDDFGAIALEIAASYPPNQEDQERDPSEDPSRHRSLDLYVDVGEGLDRAEPAYPRPELHTVEFNFKRRRHSQRDRLQWQQDFASQYFFGLGICSWPPEDERIENFFDFLRKRALQSISEDHTTVEEFTSSMLDGLDFRETMRNWHRGRLYVRRERVPPGNVGPVVLVWKDCLLTEQLWRTTLYAENQNESDISVYCAPLGKEMVGPMIARTEYHGILSVFPARGIPDVWTVQELYQWRTSARLLLASAILLCEEKYVAWVAPTPPDRDLVEYARQYNVGIIYLPLASFSRKTLKRLRQVHILGNRQARTWAADYISD